MTKHLVNPNLPPLQHAEQQVNATQPSGNVLRRVAEGFNYVSCRQKKLILDRAQNLLAVTGGSSAAIVAWPAYFRTGENTTALEVCLGITKTSFGAVSPPRANCIVFDPSDLSTVASADIYFDGANAGTSVTPDEISHQRLLITGLSPNTEYGFRNELTQGMTLVYQTVAEATVRHADDTVTGVVSPAKYPVGGPIYDEHIADLIAANNALWRHNGAHYLSWSCDYEVSTAADGVPTHTTPQSVAGAYTDLDSFEFLLPLQYHTTRNRTTVPCRLAVLAQRASGAGTLDVSLYDGTNRVAVTGIGAGGISSWSVATVSMPASDATWRIQARHPGIQGTGGTTHAIYGVSLFPFET